MFKRSQKELLAQADLDKDCIPAPPVVDEAEEHEAEWRAVGAERGAARDWPWAARPKIGGRAALLTWIEKIALVVESAVNRLIGAQSLNPFYHTGTIAVYLCIVVAVTGLYLTVFYIAPGLGTGAAYDAVTAIDNHWLWIGRIMRGVHRYASGAAVIATLLHALRTLFEDRFRGARWLAWLTGMLLLAVLWLEGLSGYWLVWDERAQLVLDMVLKAINVFPSVGVPYALDFITNEATAQIWIFFLLLLFAHIALFTVMGLFYWFHILRLSRAKFLPPRYFMIVVGAILVVTAISVPATSAREADLSRLPGRLTIDPFYLFYLPATLRTNPAIFWSVTLAAFGFVTAIPWLFKGKEPGKVAIDKNTCTGCTKCAEDCPYNAIVMLPRTDGTLRAHKLVAIENPNLCVSCGICIGSCDGMAVSLTDLPVTPYFQSVLARIRAAQAAAGSPVRVVFTCERHGAHRGRGEWRGEVGGTAEVIVMPCVGVLHPNVVGQAVDAGATEVAVVGCPPDDCAQREGNLWIEGRLHRTRLPRLKRQYVGAPIRTAWLPPNEFARVLKPQIPNPKSQTPSRNGAQWKTGSNGSLRSLKPAHFIRGGLLLAAFLALLAAVTNVEYQPYGPNESLLQLGMRSEGELREASRVLTGPELAELSHDEQVEYLNEQHKEGRFPTRLRLEIDGKVVLDKSYEALGFREEGSSFAYEEFYIPSGKHMVKLSMADADGILETVIERPVDFAPGQIHALTFDRVAEAFELK